jgi:hypothetical protein
MHVNLVYQAPYRVWEAHLLFLLGCDTVRLLKLAVTLAHPHILSHDLSSSPFLHLKKKEGQKEEREREKEIGRNTGILEVLLPFPPRDIAEQDWTPSTVMRAICKNS